MKEEKTFLKSRHSIWGPLYLECLVNETNTINDCDRKDQEIKNKEMKLGIR